jgi:long-chain acyl-CoA synthetase
MDKPWFSQYEEGIPHEIPAIAYKSLADFCEQVCARYGDMPAFTNFDSSISYREFGELTRSLAAFLTQKLKLSQGDRVAIMMPNILSYPVGIFGILRAGLIAVNVNPQYTKPELLHQLQDCGAKAIIVWDGAASVVAAAIKEMQNPPLVIVTGLGDLMPAIKKYLFAFVLRFVKKQIPSWHIENAYSFNDVLKQGKNIKLPAITVSLEDVAFLQYTGGTTGVPKGAMLSHHNMLANLSQASEWVKNVLKPGVGDIAISPLPFYHIFSLLANCFLFMQLGGNDVLITNPRDIPHLIATLKKYPFNFFTGVNTLFNALMNDPGIKDVDFSTMKLNLGGGMAVQIAVAERWQQITGKTLLEGYGLSETSPAVTIMPANSTTFIGSCGVPVPSTDIEIRDEQGTALGIKESGELWVKGPQVMLGYWQQAQETVNVLKDGWFDTGDIAMVDENGFVFILDRKKDMIIVSGFNVYPNEIEDVVAKLPGVLEVAAIGVPDEHSGETVKLFIVKKDLNLTAEDVEKYCHENLTGYKRPKYIEFRTELPKTNVGKILRRALREDPSVMKK